MFVFELAVELVVEDEPHRHVKLGQADAQCHAECERTSKVKPGLRDVIDTARVKTLKTWRDKKARHLDIDPALICNKAMIAAIAVQNPHDMNGFEAIEDMKNWQKRTFGREILAVLKR